MTGQEIAPALASLTATGSSVSVPVFLTRNVHCDGVAEVGLGVAVHVGHGGRLGQLQAGRLGDRRRRSTTALDVTVALAGFLPVAVAVLLTTPASTSAWVIGVRGRRAGGRGSRAPASWPGSRSRRPSASVTADAGDGRRAGVLDQERPGDLVAQVGLAVAVDVGHRGRLGQLERRGLRHRRRGRRRVGRDGRVGRVLAGGRRRVVDHTGVDLGLGDRCAHPTYRWSRLPAPKSLPGRRSRPPSGR